MCDVGKSRFFADFRDILVRLHEFSLGVHNAGDVDILDDRAVGAAFKLPAQIILADVEFLSQQFQIHIFLIMTMNITDHVGNPASHLRLGRNLLLAENGDQEQMKDRTLVIIRKCTRVDLFR